MECPRPNWADAWDELTGFVNEAVADGGTIDPDHMQAYMRELKHNAFAEVHAWINERKGPNLG
jgi:putative alpha-1,2-mannosidase